MCLIMFHYFSWQNRAISLPVPPRASLPGAFGDYRGGARLQPGPPVALGPGVSTQHGGWRGRLHAVGGHPGLRKHGVDGL